MTDIYKFIYKRDKPFSMKILSLLFLVVALVRISHTPVFSIIVGIGSIGLLGYQSGIEVDFQNKKYRLITIFGPQSFGDWKPLPPLKYISVFKAKIITSMTTPRNITVSQKGDIIQVNLISDKNKVIRLFYTEDVNEAFEFANQTAPKLQLKIWNATVKPAKWL